MGKYHIASTIVVLNLQWLDGEFPPSMYHPYHGTPAYGSTHTSRLIVVYMVPESFEKYLCCHVLLCHWGNELIERIMLVRKHILY